MSARSCFATWNSFHNQSSCAHAATLTDSSKGTLAQSCLRTPCRWNKQKTGSLHLLWRTNILPYSQQQGMWSLKSSSTLGAKGWRIFAVHKSQDPAMFCSPCRDVCNPSVCRYSTWSIVKRLRFPVGSNWMLPALLSSGRRTSWGLFVGVVDSIDWFFSWAFRRGRRGLACVATIVIDGSSCFLFVQFDVD